MDRIFYSAALINLALIVAGCYPQALLDEAPAQGADIAGALPALIANPANGVAWWQIGGAVAVLAAAGFFGPKAAAKVKSFFGKK